jgi:hypothetical protein
MENGGIVQYPGRIVTRKSKKIVDGWWLMVYGRTSRCRNAGLAEASVSVMMICTRAQYRIPDT